MFSIKDTADTSILIKRERASDKQGWMLWGLPVAIPEKYRFCLLDYLFEEHHGICHEFFDEGLFLVVRIGCRYC